MDEFATLFLRGKYAEDMKTFVRLIRILSLIGVGLILILTVLSWQSVPFWLVALFSVAGFAVEEAANLLDLLKPRRLALLAYEQSEENALSKAGEERARHQAVYRAYRTAFAGFSSGSRLWVLGIIRILAPAVLAVTCLFVSAGAAVNDVLLYAVVAASLLAGGAGVYNILSESKARATFYRLAQFEIDGIKRDELHYSPVRAAKEAETAQAASSIPAPVELFLKEEIEREDFRSVSKRSTATGMLLGALYFVVLIAAMIGGNVLEALGAGASWSIILAVFAVILVVSFVSIFPVVRRQKEIFMRNTRKLGDGEQDRLRGELQMRWIKSQRAGNIMFGCFTVGSIAFGAALGLIGYFTSQEGMPLSQSLAVGILPVLVYAAIISLVVWTVMYAIARRKMKPVEIRLRELVRMERT